MGFVSDVLSPVPPLPYLYFWNRHGRKGQPCEVLIRSRAMNSCLVRFADGYTMVTSRNAVRKNPATVASRSDHKGKNHER